VEVYLFVSLVYICTAVGDPVIKRGMLGSSYQEGSVGIQLSRGECWDPVIMRGRVGIQSSRGEC
jgi:hypothetical protein